MAGFRSCFLASCLLVALACLSSHCDAFSVAGFPGGGLTLRPSLPHGQIARQSSLRRGNAFSMCDAGGEEKVEVKEEKPKKTYFLPKDKDLRALIEKVPRGTEKALQVLAGLVIVGGFANYFAFGDLPEAGTSSKMWLSGFILWFVGIALERQPGT